MGGKAATKPLKMPSSSSSARCLAAKKPERKPDFLKKCFFEILLWRKKKKQLFLGFLATEFLTLAQQRQERQQRQQQQGDRCFGRPGKASDINLEGKSFNVGW